ncbi:MAG: TA system VapC family ribonuclease toxin [Terriglobales bacterium]
MVANRAVALLDVNVLLAMGWSEHASLPAVEAWIGRHAGRGWATCPLTEAGFVRILSNPAFSRGGISLGGAQAALRDLLRHPAHEFWPDRLNFAEAMALFGHRLQGHSQITDAYLLALALHNHGRLVTLDRGVRALLAADSPLQAAIVTL